MRNVDQRFKELGENLSRSGNKYFRKQSKAWSMHDRMKKNTVGSCLNKDIWSFFLLQSNCICMDSVLTSIDGGQGSRISIIITISATILWNCHEGVSAKYLQGNTGWAQSYLENTYMKNKFALFLSINISCN